MLKHALTNPARSVYADIRSGEQGMATEDPDAKVVVFRRNRIWCCSESAQGRFLTGALGVPDNTSERRVLEAAREKFPHVQLVNISRGPDVP